MGDRHVEARAGARRPSWPKARWPCALAQRARASHSRPAHATTRRAQVRLRRRRWRPCHSLQSNGRSPPSAATSAVRHVKAQRLQVFLMKPDDVSRRSGPRKGCAITARIGRAAVAASPPRGRLREKSPRRPGSGVCGCARSCEGNLRLGADENAGSPLQAATTPRRRCRPRPRSMPCATRGRRDASAAIDLVALRERRHEVERDGEVAQIAVGQNRG